MMLYFLTYYSFRYLHIEKPIPTNILILIEVLYPSTVGFLSEAVVFA